MSFILAILYKSLGRIPVSNVNYLKLNNFNVVNERQTCLTAVAFSENSHRNQKGPISLPPEPQECCMSGCANCVWIKYAEEVAKQLGDGGKFAKAEIIKNVKDPNLRAFLLIELDHMFKEKEN